MVLQVAMDLVFASKGAPLWKMQAGMGDTVFTPFHEVLRRRGDSREQTRIAQRQNHCAIARQQFGKNYRR